MSHRTLPRRLRRAGRPQGAATASETARRLAHLEALRTLAVAEQERERRDEGRVVPVSGSGRHKAKQTRRTLEHRIFTLAVQQGATPEEARRFVKTVSSLHGVTLDGTAEALQRETGEPA